MNTSLTLVIVIVIAVLGIGYLIGKLITLRSGMIRAAAEASDIDTSGLGLSATGPTILHFTAAWCGPCSAVRRVVDQVCADVPAVAHVEIDMDDNPEAARRLSVLSLPTTIIFDGDGRPRYRTTGVPKAADLRSALEPLLA
ncbi:thioredoxin family protein [Mycolicibacterium diernhoferi]|uniref:Thioredoxin n=1 Tax=Mycolicibacterium diernhoferi TaxID=1801 RepID=A0A1Q4HD05_9MYCO|nr:thioredoxin family protein [Mycolicibacterium diernhoferi]OJZ65410.1 thiol reductase thioredoxin [Mycolicibacterium diernhoferi]OPE55593.1 thiol reductase thioredoxin [Mycolicibacterium diernhoferi]PEG52927.1 thioredoxin [Mycolicibacterium diernhoferi]QYL22142.1 thioredoxin family protein [Mycolicibacterium diernhoferi]